MRNSFARIACVFLTLTFAGCATTPSKGLDQVRKGMDKDQVLNLAGDPQRTFRSNDADHWLYTYTVDNKEWRRDITFEGGKVSSITRAQAKEEWVKDLEKADSMEEFEQKAREHEQKSGGKFKSIDGEPDDASTPAK